MGGENPKGVAWLQEQGREVNARIADAMLG